MSEEPFKFNHQFTFTFHTSWMEPCKKCQALNGKTFQGQDIFNGTVWDPIWGDIWDVENDLPLTHPNCKCYLDVQYESSLEELLHIKPDGFEEFKIMTSNIKEMKADIADFEQDLARVETRMENNRQQLITYLMLLNRLGLPPEAERAISVLIKFRMTAETAVRASYMLMAASGPWGWGTAIATTMVAVIGTTSIAMELGAQ